MIDNKLQKIILKTYGLPIFPFDKQCFICKIFNQELGLATNAHSISKGHNFIGNVWYTFYHDKRNLDNKRHLTNKKTLIQVSPQSASVSLSICNNHDSRFHIFEDQNIVEMNNIEHLYLLKIRTMLYFYYIAENDLINLKNRKSFLIGNQSYFNDNKNYYKDCLIILNNRISDKTEIVNQMQNLKYLTRNYWKDTSSTFYWNDFEQGIFLDQTEPLILIPLNSKAPIVGSFFLTKKQMQEFLNSCSFHIDRAKDFMNQNYLLNEEDPPNEDYEETEEDDSLIFINLINNKDKPFLLIMGNNNQESKFFLFSLFKIFLFNKKIFNLYLLNWLTKSNNVYYEENFLQKFNKNEKQELINFHNQEIDSIPANFLNNFNNLMLYNKNESYVKHGGFKYRNNSIIEQQPCIEILNWESIADPHNIYIEWNFRIGNGHSFVDRLGLIGHENIWEEKYILSVGRSASPDFLFYEILRMEVEVENLENWFYDCIPEDDDELPLENKLEIKLLKRKLFNSNFGEIYYDFLGDFPCFLEDFIKKEIQTINNKILDPDENIDIFSFYKLKKLDFIKALNDYAFSIRSNVKIIDSTKKELYLKN